MNRISDNYIDGKWSKANGSDSTQIVNPTTEAEIGTVAYGSPTDVAAAAQSAAKALSVWSSTPPDARAAVLERSLKEIEARSDALVESMAREIGVPIWFGKLLQLPMPLRNGAVAIDTIRTMRWSEFMGTSLVSRVPVGVIGAITPWNAPLHQIVAKVIAALAAGCTIVLKPSEIAPTTAVLFADSLAAAGLPPGVFNMVWGGPEIGSAICNSPSIDMVSFTGSERAGMAVAEAAGRQGKRVVLELGGKSAAIIMDDAPLEKAIPAVLTSCFANSGQTCVAQSRMIVPRRSLGEIEDRCRAAMKTWTIGDPLQEATRLGPVATSSQYRRVMEYIARGAAEGAEAIGADGTRNEPERGYFVSPTVFSKVDPSMTIAKEEIFGPVLAIIPYEDERDAIAIANDSVYGLSGSVWSVDQERALRVASSLRTGQVSLNGAPQNFLAPFGGFKKSGFGRENGRFGVEEFLQYQTIHGAPGSPT
ncbi:aldehyde dehydrogenase family protein [Bradyrhizobium mercantei]|uniref:aldehyde dehydrogenase family protein n=1 Tax=Bradyrhizobium mercantei TaxID=1904807 RepID=UPI0009753BD4|nr:aldehyde dehydrogenase family protein [Bradyrhizobium mercantei]